MVFLLSFYFLEFENLLLISYLLLVLKLDIFTFIFLITRIQKIQLLSLDLLKIYNLEVVSLMATIKLESVLSLFIFPNHQLFILGLMVDINFGFLVVILFSVESVYFLILFFSFSTRDLLKFINATNDYFHGGYYSWSNGKIISIVDLHFLSSQK